MLQLKYFFPSTFNRKLKRILKNSWESARYRFSRKQFHDKTLYYIIFVCKGNICRSAFAEYYFKSLISEKILRVESCGLDVDQGNISPLEAVKISKEFGIDLSRHHAKGLIASNFHKADLILPMEYQQVLRLINIFPEYKYKIRLLREFASYPFRLMCNINDPFGLDEDEFRRCFLLIQNAINGLKKHITISS